MNSEPPRFQSPYQNPAPVPPKKKPPVWLLVLLGCGGCGVLTIAIMAALLFPVFLQGRTKGRAKSCMYNVKQNVLAFEMYIQDYDATFPPAKTWMDTTNPYIKNANTLHCPEVSARANDATANYGYSYNSKLSSAALAKIAMPYATMLIYDSTNLTRNASDPLTSLNLDRHDHSGNVGYVDGHTKALRQGGQAASTPDN